MSKASEPGAVNSEPSPWTRPWFIASAGVVVVLLALAIVYVFLPAPAATTPATQGIEHDRQAQVLCD